jgi:chromosome segregation ATPase
LNGNNTDEADPETIKKSLDEAVQKLDQTAAASKTWGEAMSSHREEWEQLKQKIHERQNALKSLVREKKSGTIGQEEFDLKYRKLQDELTDLEFQVYNLRLGTSVQQ